MNMLIVGSSDIWSIEQHYAKYLNEIQGVKASIFSTSTFNQEHLNVVRRVERRLAPSRNSLHYLFNQALLSTVYREKPDVVLVFKGMEVYPDTLKKINKVAFTANYNPDHPFIFSSRGSGNKNVRKSIGLYRLHFSYHRGVCARIEEEYNIPCHWLPFGYELDPLTYDELMREETTERMRVCFIGNPDAKRVLIIKHLLQNNIPVDVFGNHWNRYLRVQKGLNIFPPVYGKDYWRTLRAYRVQLNIFRPHNEGSHNMRSIEIPAVGGIMLAPDSEEHRILFDRLDSIFYYRDIIEMTENIKHILILSSENIQRIKLNLHNYMKKKSYAYSQHAKELYQKF
jgi:hypothetical protein